MRLLRLRKDLRTDSISRDVGFALRALQAQKWQAHRGRTFGAAWQWRRARRFSRNTSEFRDVVFEDVVFDNNIIYTIKLLFINILISNLMITIIIKHHILELRKHASTAPSGAGAAVRSSKSEER